MSLGLRRLGQSMAAVRSNPLCLRGYVTITPKRPRWPSPVPSIRQELVALFQPICTNPQIVEPSGAANKFPADFTLTSAMEMFRSNKDRFTNPAKAAEFIVTSVPQNNDFHISSTGFYVNIKLSDALISSRVNILGRCNIDCEQLPTVAIPDRKRVVVDFSSPNIAKQMHVGHLRSTIIGNCLANIHEFVGNETIRVNHLGDWGTQFGTLLAHIQDIWGETAAHNIESASLDDLTKLYRDSKRRYEADPEFKERAKYTTVLLQSGKEPSLTELWTMLCKASINSFDNTYLRLGIPVIPGWYVGESFYQNQVHDSISDLQPFITQSDSDKSILLYTGIPEAKLKDKDEVPLVLRKSDGGIGYDATDVAAVRYRLVNLAADNVVYVTDAGQALHFKLVFESAQLAKWTSSKDQLVHIPFGVVRNRAGGRIKTREGDAETLESLLDSAQSRMRDIFNGKHKNHQMSPEQATLLDALAEYTGVCCVIFADLRTNRTLDYEFSLDRMCNPSGDSAVFLLHVMEKVRRMLKSTKNQLVDDDSYCMEGASARERTVAVLLAKFHDVVETSKNTQSPHVLCVHMLALAGEASGFMEDKNELIFDITTGEFHPNRGKQRYLLMRAARNVLIQECRLIGLETLLDSIEPLLIKIEEWKNMDML